MKSATVVASILSILLSSTTAFEQVDVFENITKLGDFCNPLSGCKNASLICFKNQCECAPGFEKSNNANDVCEEVGCQTTEDCSKSGLDMNRMCYKGSCSKCKEGLFLDQVANRCVTKLGSACKQTKDCRTSDYVGQIRPTDKDDLNSMPICRSGRCVCKTDYFPTVDWSACKPVKCSRSSECNPFGDDPQRYCSKTMGSCQCSMGYYEESRVSVCLPYIPIQYSLMMPFWLTMIMFTICILVYISRRLAHSRAIANEEAGSAASVDQTAHTLNRPPPSYETIVKETVPANTNNANNEPESQPPNYSSALTTSIRQA